MNNSLEGIKVLDLTRVLAGPYCTQMLGDLGADIIKVERPGSGDDTRGFAPPFVKNEDGADTDLSAYYCGANRNKRSITINLSEKEGQNLVRKLLVDCDILVENFKTGTLQKYGLSYNDLKKEFPKLIYCSITGFGQTGPYASRPGYDGLIQAMGGVMALTGDPDGEPIKVGVPIGDLMAGMFASVGILAAVRHQILTGEGQFIDIGMLDTHVAWLANQGMNYLATNKNPERLGNQHPNIVPYQVMPTSDGYIVLSIGNDPTFERFCKLTGEEHLIDDPKFKTNADRVLNREFVTNTLNDVTRKKPSQWWLTELEKEKIGCGPINTLSEVFSDPHVKAREMVVEMKHQKTGKSPLKLIANPIKMDETPPTYRMPPPLLGEHTEQILSENIGLSQSEILELKVKKII
jgi:crotonobetainyl-CoA:carnitine CoA-transferase CaiB-like acyl-CoA transferase|tara:strand:- start:410 stop:1627 length:1218 start_codon:yes stop_codon:yes gene_type:complete